MKKILAATAISSLLAFSAFAQGTVDFRNKITSPAFDQPVFDLDGSTKLAGPNFVAQLFWSDTQLGTYTALTDPAAPFRTGAGAGYWNYGATFTRTIPGLAGNATAWLIVRVWDSTLSANWDALTNTKSKWASSTPFSVVLGNYIPPGGTPTLPATLNGFTSLTLKNPVPEPATYALLALGAGALLIRRRK